MRVLSFWFLVVITVGITWALDQSWFGMPPLGKLFSPTFGFWANVERELITQENHRFELTGIKQPVEIHLDERLIPHIFAENEYDLYFAQGYITAKYRLWQMETQIRAAAGRLSEVLGERTLNFDRLQRRLGLRYAAEQALTYIERDSTTKKTLSAYTDGVNAYIRQLKYPDYPLEYKLLDYAPEPWSNLKTALLLKYMAQSLTGYANDATLDSYLYKYNKDVINNLFPNFSPFTDPVVPAGTKWNFKPVPVPVPPVKIVTDSSYFANVLFDHDKPLNGSNTWALSGTKTASGYPILANDPHLSLRLPSLWFEVQLVAPGINVYGVTLPGAPGVIIGFNEKVVWGLTNSGVDVFDLYQIRFNDRTRSHYWYESRWNAVKPVIETIAIRGKPAVVDTVAWTHHGPVVALPGEQKLFPNYPPNHALRWIAHDPSNEVLTFYKLNRAANYDDFIDALKTYVCPAQNISFADANDIAIITAGRLPLRWKNQGKFLLDGTDKRFDWLGTIPTEERPSLYNPKRGFVSAANQAPVDTTYPYYLGWRFEPFERGVRINQRLEAMTNARVDSMRALLNDNYNVLAAKVLPFMLRHTAGQDNNRLLVLNRLKNWNLLNDAHSPEATAFNLWWYFLNKTLWDDDFQSAQPFYPDRGRTAALLLKDSTSKWFDNRKTPRTETYKDVLNTSFNLAVDSLYRIGDNPEQWAWAKQKNTHIEHLAGIPGFGRSFVNIGGGVGIVNATREDHGPSWRMVVALGPAPRGFGIYPGGQSGNPVSAFYDNRIDRWAAGELDELQFIKNKKSGKSIKSVVKLLPIP